jgi:hypothetical protein
LPEDKEGEKIKRAERARQAEQEKAERKRAKDEQVARDRYNPETDAVKVTVQHVDRAGHVSREEIEMEGARYPFQTCAHASARPANKKRARCQSGLQTRRRQCRDQEGDAARLHRARGLRHVQALDRARSRLMLKRHAIALTITLLATPAFADSRHEMIGMLVSEAMRPGDEDAQVTGRAMLDALNTIRSGGRVERPDKSCDSPQCVGTLIAVQTVKR